jgi:hypothetical protein
MSVELNKPYMYADVEMKHEKQSSKLLLDLGNTDSVWLFPVLIKDFVYNRPNIDDFLGRGFSGDILEKEAESTPCRLANSNLINQLQQCRMSFLSNILILLRTEKALSDRKSFGGFLVIFDYPGKKVYFKPNQHLDDPFLIDGSGLEIKQDGLIWEQEQVKVETAKKILQEMKSMSWITVINFNINFL